MRQNLDKPASRDALELFGKFMLACDENQNYPHCALFATPCWLYSKSIFPRSFILKDYSSFGSQSVILIDLTFTFTLTHSEKSNHNDPHDNQSPIPFN
jgi:hypothetical protein